VPGRGRAGCRGTPPAAPGTTGGFPGATLASRPTVGAAAERIGDGVPDLDAAIVGRVSSGAFRIPPYPAVAMKLEELLPGGDFGLADVARLIASDQALTADVLRCANSALYARGTPAVTVPQALTRVGAAEVRRLALASGLGAQARGAGALASLRRRAWLESLAAALVSQELALANGLDPEVGFVCGLLHDFGKVIAVACVEDIAAAGGARPLPQPYWLEVVDRYHVELGIAMAGRWELPPVVSDAVALHHAEDIRGAAQPAMVEAVMAADEVVRLLGERVRVGPADLEEVPLLGPAARQRVAAALGALPGFVAAFEGEASAGSAPSSLIEAARPGTGMGKPTPLECPAAGGLGTARREYRAVCITETNLVLHGREALPEHVLLRLEVASRPALACWGTVKLGWPEGGGRTALVSPFALDEQAHQTWRQLVASAPGA